MNAAHAYRVEATLPALLCSFENFSGFQITRISMSLRFIKMSVDRFRNPLANIHLFLIITTFSQKKSHDLSVDGYFNKASTVNGEAVVIFHNIILARSAVILSAKHGLPDLKKTDIHGNLPYSSTP